MKEWTRERAGPASVMTTRTNLVTGTNVLGGAANVDTLGNVRGLLLNGDDDIASLVVEALGGVIIANLGDGLANDLLVVDGGLGGDLTEDHDHAGLGGSLAGNLGVGVLGQAGIKDGIRDLIADLVGVALVDGLGGEEEGLQETAKRSDDERAKGGRKRAKGKLV
jgi:hypothetical protein